MTRIGQSVSAAAVIALGAGYALRWPSLLVVGAVGLITVAYSFATTRTMSSLVIERSLHPKKVTKGATSVAMLHLQNPTSRRSSRINVAQSIGDEEMIATLPSLFAKQSGLKSVPLPTRHRGHFLVSPVVMRKSDPFGFFKNEKVFGTTEELWVQPSVVGLRPLSRGMRRDFEGATSDRSPVGNVAFHRIREYVPGDDPRLIDWKVTARRSTSTVELMVRHNVDTTQPATMVVVDTATATCTSDAFEELVDVAASVTRASLLVGGNLDLVTSNGERVGLAKSSVRDDSPILDFLTDVTQNADSNLMATLRKAALGASGTTLIVITGELAADELATLDAVSRRFSRVICVAITGRTIENPFAQVNLITGSTLEQVAAKWNEEMRG